MFENNSNDKFAINLHSKISDIIINSGIADTNTKNTLNDLFNALSDFTVNQLKSIENKSTNTSVLGYSLEDQINIYTALVSHADYNDMKFPSFSPIASTFGKINIYEDDSEKDVKNFIGVFFCCDYEQFIEITDSGTYNRYYQIIIDGKTLLCQFEVDYTFVTKENTLQNISHQYGINVPMIFSPYSRRFARIKFIDNEVFIDVKKIKTIEFPELAEYISGTTISHTLVWNIKIIANKPIPSFSDSISSIDVEELVNYSKGFNPSKYLIASQHYKYMQEYKCRKNEYILFENPNNLRLALSRNIKSSILYVMYNSEESLHSETRVTISQPSDIELKNMSTYQNYFDKGLYLLPRLHTFADISYVINCFTNNPYSLSIGDFTIERNNNIQERYGSFISPYNQYHRYYGRISREINIGQKIPLHSTASTPIYCIIPFVGGNRFKDDYIRYVIEFLSHNYPEVLWQATWREK
ncbi:MAG: hypothetical protein OSJ61_03665 [Lachnospiraceae bacterium]|nr:hypothetical protein [Lachnospiraceae bacterium]